MRKWLRIGSSIAGLVVLAGCGGHDGDQLATQSAPQLTPVGSTVANAPAGGPLTISSPAFADRAQIPVRFTCKGANVAPPLTWSAPSGAALVVDDPDAVHGVFVHWIVTGIPSGSGSTTEGQTPGGGTSAPNSAGQSGYHGPCPPAGTGTHHYRFTLYQLPDNFQLPGGLGGTQAAQQIAVAATAHSQLTGTFGN